MQACLPSNEIDILFRTPSLPKGARPHKAYTYRYEFHQEDPLFKGNIYTLLSLGRTQGRTHKLGVEVEL